MRHTKQHNTISNTEKAYGAYGKVVGNKTKYRTTVFKKNNRHLPNKYHVISSAQCYT